MGGWRSRRWPRRLALLAALAAGVALFRERMLARNAKRFGLPG